MRALGGHDREDFQLDTMPDPGIQDARDIATGIAWPRGGGRDRSVTGGTEILGRSTPASRAGGQPGSPK
jgi:hypothetical protein